MPRPLSIPTPAQRHNDIERRVRRLERRSAGPWHYVDATGEPAFQNGWANIAGYVGTRFRWLLGGGIEIQLACDGGTAGTTIFTLPAGYYVSGEGNIPGSGHDSSGTYRAWHIDSSTGDVIDGV